MKPPNLLVSALCVTVCGSSLLLDPFPLHGRVLLPRGKDNDAHQTHESSNRGGYGRQGKAAHTESDVKRVEDVIDQGRHAPRPPRPQDTFRDTTPPGKVDAIKYDRHKNEATIYMGPHQQQGSDQTRARNRHDPREDGALYQPRARNKEEKRAGEQQRGSIINTIPKARGAVVDHKPMSALRPLPGQRGTAAYDHSTAQGFEGQMVRAAIKPVIDNGYDDPADSSTWKGKGGVRIQPNMPQDPRWRPEIGFPGMRAHKYEDDDGDVHVQKRKDRHSTQSRSNSDSSLNSQKPPKKKDRHGKSQRRDIAGVGDIASSEATTSSAQYQTQNSTGQDPDLQDYLDAWTIIHDNATDIIWPYLVDMLEGSNSTMVITAAWSVYAHMIPTTYGVNGPFCHGLTSLPSLEAAWASEPNMTNATLQGLFTINDILTDLYSAAWDGSYQALNSSGVLDDLNFLTDMILSYNSTLPLPMPDPDNDPIADWFYSYISIVPDSELDLGNSTGNSTGTTSPTILDMSAPVACSSGSAYSNGTLCTATAGPTATIYPRRAIPRRH